MTVGELKALLADLPDDRDILVAVPTGKFYLHWASKPTGIQKESVCNKDDTPAMVYSIQSEYAP